VLAKSIFWRTGAALGTYVTATSDLSEEERLSARRSRMYSAALGVMCDSRLERSERKDDELDGIEAPGMMVSFWMVASSPRCEVEVMRLPRADLSSWEATRMLAENCGYGKVRSVPAIPDCILAGK
jgi:hypothetical protein